jgi:tRNA 5-methylaminomethyl-2-thiouridine biosynthesis bifunctional protein
LYDLAIIGAGINGSSLAYEFIKKGQKVILFDMEGIASGGSGAAGAFISPKFSKSGELKELIDKAFIYSMQFYEQNFPSLFTKATLIHTSQDNEEKYTLESGMVNAEAMCNALCEGVTLKKQKVESLYFDDGFWTIDESYSAKNIVLAIGAYEQIIKEPYIQLRGIWGHRIDIKTSSENKNILHQFVSISPSRDGMLSIGATHNVHYHPETSKEAYDLEKGREELLEKASQMIDLEDVEVVKDYTGLRPGSNDYMPLVGSLVISKETLASKSIQFQRKNPDYAMYTYYPNLYMINGNAGYGFVLAPYLAKMLQEHILNAKSIDERLAPARFFARWARRL